MRSLLNWTTVDILTNLFWSYSRSLARVGNSLWTVKAGGTLFRGSKFWCAVAHRRSWTRLHKMRAWQGQCDTCNRAWIEHD